MSPGRRCRCSSLTCFGHCRAVYFSWIPKTHVVSHGEIGLNSQLTVIQELVSGQRNKTPRTDTTKTEMMPTELALTPGGTLLPICREEGSGEGDAKWANRIAEAFSKDVGEGLFLLAAEKLDSHPTASFAYFREFARLYLARLCHLPQDGDGQIEPLDPPEQGELGPFILGVPPMQGAEYISVQVLQDLWRRLDEWTRGRVGRMKGGLGAFLTKHAPRWHQVGRVCFHLAENKRNEDYPFAFMATYTPGLSKKDRVQHLPLGRALDEYAGAKNKKLLVKLLSPVNEAAKRSPFVQELVESGELFHPLAWTPDEAYRLLKDAPLLDESGVVVRLPDWWKKRPRPRVSVTVGEKSKGRLGMDALLSFNVGLALGEETLSDEEWQSLMEGTDGLVFLKGQWVEVDREKLDEALEHWRAVKGLADDGAISFVEGMRLLAGASADLTEAATAAETAEWAFVQAGGWLRERLEGLRDPESLDAVKPGRNLRATLRPYQEVGAGWLSFLSELGIGACLADDMGLGKTIQVLALLTANRKKKQGPSLLVLPASLLSNWKAEIERFAPKLVARYIHPSETPKDRLAAMAENPDEALGGVDVVLTTYAMLSRQKWLLDVAWNHVVLDEAQAIKNPGAKQTKTVKKLNSRSRIALTGTPVENRLSDLWSLFDFLCPGLLGSANTFKGFVKSLQERETAQYAPLRNLVRPYILRRLKTDKTIIADLPDKTEVRAFCGLSKTQAAVYKKSVRELADSLKTLDGMQRRGLVLAFLMRFKQICNHPSQFLGDGGYDPKDSGKFSRLRAICEEIALRQEKVLVFTQFREMTDPLADFLAGIFGREGLILHGGTPVKRRRSLVEAFGREDGPPFFVLSLKAGGTGLNLTAASHVIHFDRWWNPAVENQATDRAFRIGQTRNVLVHKFVCQGTVEEQIDKIIEEKTAMADEVLDGGAEKLLTEMGDDELLSFVSLDVERVMVRE